MDNFDKIFIFYVVMAVLTFGYAANAEFYDGETRNLMGYQEVRVTAGDRILIGMLSGMVWPLYVTYKAFHFVRPEKPKQNQ